MGLRWPPRPARASGRREQLTRRESWREGGSEGGKVGRRGLCCGRGQCRLGARM